MRYEAPSGPAAASKPVFRIYTNRKRLIMETLTERLAAASGEAEVVSALLSYLEGKFDRGSFLGLKLHPTLGWQAVGVGTRGCAFHGGPFALAGASQLQQVVRAGLPFVGELRADEGDGWLIEALGEGAACTAALVPLAVGGRVVAVLCASDRQERLAAWAPEARRVASASGLAFGMLCIKKSIRSG